MAHSLFFSGPLVSNLGDLVRDPLSLRFKFSEALWEGLEVEKKGAYDRRRPSKGLFTMKQCRQ